MKIFEVIYVRETELPLFQKTLRLEKVEKTIKAKSLNSLRRKLLSSKPDDFILFGVKEIKNETL